ncbi:MAG: ABC transporter ATP-binding protein [Alicyclobacillaceae bacterium]|nr:ABC transporter ATP-binding protein [Alicyclobacillaceae bacterium]
MADPLLAIRNLRTYFIRGDVVVRAVDGVDLDVYRRQIVCIVGESGCGKTMTALSVMRLVPKPHGTIVGGSIWFEGRDLLALTEAQMASLRGSEIAMVFQDPMTALNPVLTIGEQIAEVLLRHRRVSKREAWARVVEMLRFVGVPRAEQIVHDYPHQLSGGLRQRATIAMAMMCGPKLLLADEPTTALDVTIQTQVLELMKQMRDDFDTAIMLITHDLGVVAEMADHVVVMYAGQVVESASADDVFRGPLHPYTKALMAAIPSVDEDRDVLYAIPGTVPDASAFPAGCRFAERCPLAQKECFARLPQLREVRPGHLVRCDLV